MHRTLFLFLLGAAALPGALWAQTAAPPVDPQGVAAPQPAESVPPAAAPQPTAPQEAVTPAPAAVAAAPPTAVVVDKAAALFQQHVLTSRALAHCFHAALREGRFAEPGEGVLAGGFFPFPPPPLGDMELISTQQAGGAADEAPCFRVTFRNKSRLAAHGFRVSVIAAIGALDRTSPVVSADVDVVAPNAVAHVDLQIPPAAMTLGTATAPTPFDTLIVVLDSLNELLETNELNNVFQFRRAEIVPVEVPATAAAPAASAPGVAPPAGVAPPPGPKPTPQPATPDGAKPGPIDLDQLDGALPRS